jgi:acyl-CoA synthetase (AMP-forming)/AMP-acid ligase II
MAWDPLVNLLAAGDGAALDFLGKRTRPRELLGAVERLSAGLRRLGLAPEAPLALLLPNTPMLLIAGLAAARLGARPLVLDPRAETTVLEARLAAWDPELIFSLDPAPLFDRVLSLLPATPHARVVVGRYADLLPFSKGALLPLLRGTGLATMPRDPRFLSYRRLLRGAGEAAVPSARARIVFEAGELGLAELVERALAEPPPEPGARWLIAQPLSEPEAWVTLLAGLGGGATVLLSPRLDRATLDKLAQRARATWVG